MKLKRMLSGMSEELVPLIKTKHKKTYLKQAREVTHLWRLHRTFPSQYLRAQLYRLDAGNIDKYLPYKVLENFQNELGRTPQAGILNDKLLFAAEMEEKGVPCIPTLAVVFQNRIVDGRGETLDDAALIESAGGRPVFAKPALGHFGGDAFRVAEFNQEIIDRLKATGEKYLVQHVVEQCPELAAFHPESLNTIRIATWNDGRETKLIAAALKVGHGGSHVDNVKAGGIVVPVDLASGALWEGAKSAAKAGTEKVYRHPDTGIRFSGMAIPMWRDVVGAVIKAADLVVPEVGTVGWDVAVTPTGPVIVEGNLNWGASLFQRTGIALGESVIGEPALRLWHEKRR